MKIIRDNELNGLLMIPLLIDWKVKRCNIRGCTNKPNTIVTQLAEGIPVAGFCEEHYQMCNAPNGAQIDLEFDDYDSFKT